MTKTTIIECATCDARVNAKVLVEREYQDCIEHPDHVLLVLECPVCSQVMIGISQHEQIETYQWAFGTPVRLWPRPKRTLHGSVPSEIGKSIEEARRCLGARAYDACTVMCGRAMEALCKAQGAKTRTLGKGLKHLRDAGVIDDRLFEWGEALRERRNASAHASGVDATREDASDLLDFTLAICEYVFVLTQRYKAFKAREAKRTGPAA